MVKQVFFDTETTGLPINRDKPAKREANNWPDLVSISWIVYEGGKKMKQETHIIKPDGWKSSPKAIEVHGITEHIAMRDGLPLREVVMKFLADVADANTVIAHNMEFDKNVIFNACYWRLALNPLPYWLADEFCSLNMAVGEMKIPSKWTGTKGRYAGYKPPTLDELYFDTFKRVAPSNAHNADRDVSVLASIVWERWDILDENGVPVKLILGEN